MLVTFTRYQSITGDYTSATADVSGALDDAQGLLEEELGRELAEAERVERCYPNSAGQLFPRVTPVIAADGFTLDGNIVRGSLIGIGWPDPIVGDVAVDLTYTGGYVERSANPDAANRLPVYVERDLALAAHALLHVPATGVATGADALASSKRVGDLAVTHTERVPTGTAAQVMSCWSPETLWLRRRRT